MPGKRCSFGSGSLSLAGSGADPKPFVWTKSAEVILKNERRALEALDAVRGNQASVTEHSDVPSQARRAQVIDAV